MVEAVILCQLVVSTLSTWASAQLPFPVAALGGGPPAGLQPMPVPMHMSLNMRPPHMPVVVMPYRSKATDHIFNKKKRRRPRYYSDESSSESVSSSDDFSSSSEFDFRGSKRRWMRKKKREVLTPVISYVTKNGRVVYQKKIKRENPSDWLHMGEKKELEQSSRQAADADSADLTVRDLKRKYKLRKRKRTH